MLPEALRAWLPSFEDMWSDKSGLSYAEENAFALCPAMRWPQWLHIIPDQGYVLGLA